ncbi:hypothetical protein SADUNF_Sadunf16G0032700 [Salix dunnii]|uniref:Uncharacterized protein n=1 Tax=Salix dunnii TaxID=1413687 RepID=A0A835JA52_9ROSI|nr:hypothetical protein SADUNF_Sadunf16G0032700 [Salix dunnii]
MPHRTRPMTALLVFTGLNVILVSTITPVYDFVCFLPYWERRIPAVQFSNITYGKGCGEFSVTIQKRALMLTKAFSEHKYQAIMGHGQLETTFSIPSNESRSPIRSRTYSPVTGSSEDQV